MKRGRGQYSVEFLVTYGWALVIIGIIIGAIYSFGWLDPQKFLPQKCVFYGQTGCKDYYLSEDGLNLSLTNNYGVPLYIKAIEVQAKGETICGREYETNTIFWPRAGYNVTSVSFTDLDCEDSDLFTSNDALRQNIIHKNQRVELLTKVYFFSDASCTACQNSAVGSGCDRDCLHVATGKVVARIES